MKALDYIFGTMKEAVSYDEVGNLYIDRSEVGYPQCELLNIPFTKSDWETPFLSKEDYDKYNQYEIIIPDGIDMEIETRRPYYRMRGKPVTKEQAFDIFRRTDSLFSSIDKLRNGEEYIGTCNFGNYLASKSAYPPGYGWVHIDGTIGLNDNTGKYPTIFEFIHEWFRALLTFPYLDLVIAVTCWNEVPDEAWDDLDHKFHIKYFYEYEDYDDKFYDAVILGIYVHDKSLEFLQPADAIEKYKEYAAKYGKRRDIYIPYYYMDNKIEQITLDDIKRAIELYGLNADEELSKIPEYRWKGR